VLLIDRNSAIVIASKVSVQVSDVDNVLGLLQTEVIQVHAEAYDVALDMTFPKGNSFILVISLTNMTIIDTTLSVGKCSIEET